jgi:hypothetical protein
MTPRRGIALSLGLLSGIAGAFFFIGNAIPSFEDFRQPEVAFWEAVVGVVISWGLPAVAFYMAYRFMREAVSSGKKEQVPRFVRDDN